MLKAIGFLDKYGNISFKKLFLAGPLIPRIAQEFSAEALGTEKQPLCWAEDTADGGRSKRDGKTEKMMGGLSERGHEDGKCN